MLRGDAAGSYSDPELDALLDLTLPNFALSKSISISISQEANMRAATENGTDPLTDKIQVSIYLQHYRRQEKVEAPFFSVHLTRGKASGSKITLGGYDMSKAVGPLTWVSVISKSYWTVHFDGAVVEGKYVSGDVDAVIDTGSSFIYVSQALANSIYANILGAGPAANYSSGFFSFPCDSNPTISFSLGGHDFGLSIQDFKLGQDGYGSTNCIGGIIGLDDAFMEGIVIIGNAFMKSWYSVFDYSHGARVGFAPSINNAQ
ncbi:aspartic peptidase domain-containing protein [Suillus americanus]|nr:aspartic peptidase domain-containing protein [Suillus americanus]